MHIYHKLIIIVMGCTEMEKYSINMRMKWSHFCKTDPALSGAEMECLHGFEYHC